MRRVLAFPFGSGLGSCYARRVTEPVAAWPGVPEHQWFTWAPPGRPERPGTGPAGSWAEYLADALAWAMPHLTSGDEIVLYGQCLGALTAYEVAQVLRPARVVLSACGTPRQMAARAADPGTVTDEDMAADLVNDFAAWPDMHDVLLELGRADLQVQFTYRPTVGRPLSMPVTLIGTRQDTINGVEDVAGWLQGEWTCGPVQMVVADGDHDAAMDQTGAIARGLFGL